MKKTILVPLCLMFISFSALSQETPTTRADKLFAERDNIESLKQAISIVEEMRAKDQSNYEALWRLAKFKFYLADREEDKSKKTKILQAAIESAKKAVLADGTRVEGHFWLGANDGEYADMKGALSSLGLVKTIRKEFESALTIDPMYQNGAAYLALGQIDLSLPRLLGGNEKRGIDRLEQGMKAAQNNSEIKIALAEVYEKKNRKDEAKRLLESVLTASDPARTVNEMEELRNKARLQLDKMK
ncbi:MAG TPA: TRAP transporter TatT component family protein [Blastocatellia bacterium]|nr:TRAP transporter TatT component family protein [Blastocatellia bacterium]